MTSTEIVFKIIEISVQAGIGLVGLIALTSWRKQLKYKEELNIAKNMLKCLYLFEEKQEQLRNGFISASEIILTYESFKIEPPTTFNSRETHADLVYAFRTNNCLNSLKELSDFSAEGRVYWDEIIDILLNELKQSFVLLSMEVEKYVPKILQYDENELEIKNYFLYGIPMDKEHEIIISINNSKKELEKFLRKRIEIEKDWVDILFFRFNPLYK